MKKPNFENVKSSIVNAGKTMANGAKVLIPIIILGLSATTSANQRTVKTTIYHAGDVQYADVIREVMSSDMFASHKTKVVDILPENADSQFYGAVLEVVKSDIFSSHKVAAITSMTSKWCS